MDFSKRFDTVVCIASGPSLTDEQVSLVNDSGLSTIAVNNNFVKAPWADILFACDIMWWHHYYEQAVNTCSPDTEFWTLSGVYTAFSRKYSKVPITKEIMEAEYVREAGLYPDKLYHGSNSGYLAVNLAYLMGATKIILIGYDHKYDKDGKRHWFGDHDKKKFRINADNTEIWVQKFENLVTWLGEEGVDVVNCSLDTDIQNARRSKLENEL